MSLNTLVITFKLARFSVKFKEKNFFVYWGSTLVNKKKGNVDINTLTLNISLMKYNMNPKMYLVIECIFSAKIPCCLCLYVPIIQIEFLSVMHTQSPYPFQHQWHIQI